MASTLEAVQNIQSVSQALQKSKENYVNKMLEQERMRKEGATQRDLDKVHAQTCTYMNGSPIVWNLEGVWKISECVYFSLSGLCYLFVGWIEGQESH